VDVELYWSRGDDASLRNYINTDYIFITLPRNQIYHIAKRFQMKLMPETNIFKDTTTGYDNRNRYWFRNDVLDETKVTIKY
jgi:hypothetical protein